MASLFKTLPGPLDFDAWVSWFSDPSSAYNWFFDQTPDQQAAPVNAADLSLNAASVPLLWENEASQLLPLSSADVPANVQNVGLLPTAGFLNQVAVVGTPGPDVFTVDIGTLIAAVAPMPVLAQISGYSAAQGDVIDFSAILRGSYAPLTADSAELRITEDAGAAFATLDFNAGTAQNPHWVALAKLDGVQIGDAVNVALDAAHTVQLHSAWLA